MQDASTGWLSYQSARLALQEYGTDAGTIALEALESADAANYPRTMVLAAIDVAAYEASGFPIARLSDIASGSYVVFTSPELNSSVRRAALGALSARPREELASFWKGLLRDPHWAVRQFAVGGLACAAGPAALDDLAPLLTSERDPIVKRVVSFHVTELSQAGDSARVCLYGAWTRNQAAAGRMEVDSGLVRKATRLFGFRRPR